MINKVGKVAYQLALPAEAQIHNIFHVLKLKEAIGHIGPIISLHVPHNTGLVFEPTAILDKKMVKRGNMVETKLLIHWKNISLVEAT